MVGVGKEIINIQILMKMISNKEEVQIEDQTKIEVNKIEVKVNTF